MNYSPSRSAGFYKRVWKLSLPMILQNLITFSLGLIDTFMVSQLGNAEMAAVSTANAPAFLLISVVFGVQSGLGILVSQYWGKRDLRSISRAIGVAAFVGAGLILVLAVLFFLFPVQVMDLLSNEHALSVLGAPYLRIIGFSYVFNMLSSVYVSAQRSVENPNFGMKVFGTSTLVNTVLNREVTDEEISGSLACDGIVSSLSALLGCLPITSFSQNVGLLAMTKVVNRFTIATGAGIMILAGIFPAVGAVLATLPEAVLGGCTIMMFGNIVISGLQMIGACGFSQRNITIAALSLSVGLGFTQVPDMFLIFPDMVRTIFAENCVAVVFLMAIILNLVMPREKAE